ncbi:MAG: hypothetical protein LVS60_14140 [Nodosilinea sp. LVE1205-7]
MLPDSSSIPWWQNFLRLALANMIANLMVPMAGLVDTAFLGHLEEIHHLGEWLWPQRSSMWSTGVLAFYAWARRG